MKGVAGVAGLWYKTAMVMSHPFSWKTLRRAARMVLAAFFVFFVAFLVWRAFDLERQKKNEEKAAWIHSQHITVADVMGENLPSEPDPDENNRTLAGVDANNNGIRDDVELAIHRLHPESARIRAAELQYAHALQFEMADVTDSKTLVAALQEESRGDGCISDTTPQVTLEDGQEKWAEQDRIFSSRKKEVEDLFFNIDMRRKRYDENLEKFMISHSLPSKDFCDVSLGILSN